MSDRGVILSELEEIRARNPRKVLIAEEVVDFASDPATALHSQFEWSNEKAARSHRLDQARGIIRAFVKLLPETNNEPIRAYVHIEATRGYSSIEAVVRNVEQRELLVIGVLRRVLGQLTSFPLPELMELEALVRRLLAEKGG